MRRAQSQEEQEENQIRRSSELLFQDERVVRGSTLKYVDGRQYKDQDVTFSS